MRLARDRLVGLGDSCTSAIPHAECVKILKNIVRAKINALLKKRRESVTAYETAVGFVGDSLGD